MVSRGLTTPGLGDGIPGTHHTWLRGWYHKDGIPGTHHTWLRGWYPGTHHTWLGDGIPGTHHTWLRGWYSGTHHTWLGDGIPGLTIEVVDKLAVETRGNLLLYFSGDPSYLGDRRERERER